MTGSTALVASLVAIGSLFSHIDYKPRVERPSFHTLEQDSSTDYRREYNVQVIYFHPSEYKPKLSYLLAVNPFVRDIQRWYLTQLGVTFNTLPLKVVRGQHDADFYNDPTALFPGQRVLDELGVNCGTKTVTLIFVARTIRHGNGRSCGPFYAGADNGDVTVSEANFDAEITGYCPGVRPEYYWWACNKNAQRGGVAHELGHAFSLPHPPACETVGGEHCTRALMWSWWYWPNVGFLDSPNNPAPAALYAPEYSTLIHHSPWFWKKLVR